MFAVVMQNVYCEVQYQYLSTMLINSNVQRILIKSRLKRLVRCLHFCTFPTTKQQLLA